MGFIKYRDEYRKFHSITPQINDQEDPSFYFNNYAFDRTDAVIYYCLLRYLRPRKVVEIGSGWSTKIAASACLLNKKTELVSIEPYPQPILRKGFPGFSKLIMKKVEDIPVTYFTSLEKNDVLFIDSSHTVKIGSDVNYLILNVLPNLKKGVCVHFHDIFLPGDYPKNWIVKEHRFWNEQYLLHAFLLFNRDFEIIYANNYMAEKYPKKLKEVFTNVENIGGGSFWLRKIS